MLPSCHQHRHLGDVIWSQSLYSTDQGVEPQCQVPAHTAAQPNHKQGSTVNHDVLVRFSIINNWNQRQTSEPASGDQNKLTWQKHLFDVNLTLMSSITIWCQRRRSDRVEASCDVNTGTLLKSVPNLSPTVGTDRGQSWTPTCGWLMYNKG